MTKYNYEIQQLNSDISELNNLFQQIINLCNSNITDIPNISQRIIDINNFILQKNTFIKNSDNNKYLLKYFIKEILLELNVNFIFMINQKFNNTIDDPNNDYYFKLKKFKDEFKNDTFQELFKKLGSFYSLIVNFINNILIDKFLYKIAIYKPDFIDIKDFEPIKL
jgi:hypothetical protein